MAPLPVISLREAAQRLGYSYYQVYSRACRGDFGEVVPLGKALFVERRKVEQAAARRAQPVRPAEAVA